MSRSNNTSSNFHSDVRFTLFAKTLYLLTRVALPPLVLARVSLADYGVWSISFIVVSYLGLTATGFVSVYIRQGALAHQSGDTSGLSRLLSTGIMSLALVSTVIFSSLWVGLPWVMEHLDVEPHLRHTAETLVLGSCAIFLADITFGGYAYLLHGIGHIKVEQKIWVVAFIFEMFLVVTLLWSGMGILSLLVAFALRYVFSLSMAAIMVHKIIPGIRLNWRLFDKSVLKEFFSYGLLVQISALFANALHSAERVLAGLLIGAPAAALFDLGNKLPSTATSIPSAISSVTLPAAARSQGLSETQYLYLSSTRLTGLITALPMPFLAILALPLCQFWLGARPEVLAVAAIMTPLALSCHAHILTGPGSSIFRGIGKAGNEFIYHGLRVFFLGLFVGIGWIQQGKSYQPTSLALYFSVGAVIAALVYLCWNHLQLTGHLTGLFQKVLVPSLCTYPAALLAYWLPYLAGWWPMGVPSRFDLWLPLLGSAFIYAVFASFIIYFWILSPSEKSSIQANLYKLLPSKST
jgi:O-antigen/teichoic acid export membrane protein